MSVKILYTSIMTPRIRLNRSCNLLHANWIAD